MGLARKHTQALAYIAGIFDGEGHVSIHRSKNGYACHASVEMTDPEAIALILDHFPTLGYTVGWSGRRWTYKFCASGHAKSQEFLKAIKPYSLVKHRQIRIALAYLAHRRRTHWKKNGNSSWECEKCAGYVTAIRGVRAEIKRVNSVNALTKHGLREYRAKPEEVEQLVKTAVGKFSPLQERVETSGEGSIPNKPISALEQDIVQATQLHTVCV